MKVPSYVGMNRIAQSTPDTGIARIIDTDDGLR